MINKFSSEGINKIVEILFVTNFFVKDDYMSEKKENILKDYKEDIFAIKNLFKDKLDFVDENFLIEDNIVFMLKILIHFLEEGKKIENTDDFYTNLLNMSENDILTLMSDDETLNKEKMINKFSDLYDTVAQKWKVVKVILNPVEMMKKYVDLLKFTEKVYTPYYKKYKKEREEFKINFNLNNFIENIKIFDKKLNHKVIENIKFICVLSPILLTFSYMFEEMLVVGTLFEKSFTNKKNDETVFEILKILSDKSRYDVLKYLVQTDMKSIEIANKLNISSAAVSFHIKKLLESHLLIASNIENSELKYKVNKELLKKVIYKFNKDFI
ncbi:MAG: winged helix-turn-helix domain-containing protein [Erysipelotrichaceae bacterium]|nr:winged helix-turn-helix domain-containing protein [Erysipelotrichaceae bacterium]